MRFEDERYVRVYTRDTLNWMMLRWEGQAVFLFLLRKADRTGVIDLGESGDAVAAVVALSGMPEEFASAGVARCLKTGSIEQQGNCLIFPKFIEAQESTMTPAARQKESRLRRRDEIRAGLDASARETVVYFIQSEHGGPIKIGRADDLAKRLLGLQTSRPDKLVVLAAFPGTVADERRLHDRFGAFRERGEWFSPAPDLMDEIRNIAAKKQDSVTNGDVSHKAVTGHETSTVTPFLAVPSRAVPSLKTKDLSVGEPTTPPDAISETRIRKPTVADEAYEHWLIERKRFSPRGGRIEMNDKDRKELLAVIKRGRTLDEMKLAFTGHFLSPHHNGTDGGTKYLAFKYALRDGNIDTFIALGEREQAKRTPIVVAPLPTDAPVLAVDREARSKIQDLFADVVGVQTSPDLARNAEEDSVGADVRWKPNRPQGAA